MASFRRAALLAVFSFLAFSPGSLAAAEARGEVQRVDVHERVITIAHGPIPALDMAAMTQDFYVADPAMLSEVRPGDKVRFEVEIDRRGRYVIIDLESE